MHLIVYSSLLTPRIKYIFNFIFKEILKVEVEFTGNSQYFLQSEHMKISYAEAPLGDELFFKSTSLLFSNKVEPIKIKTVPFGEGLAPFPVEQSALSFDVFAASFFMLSRYEEYLFKDKSEADFKAKDSLQVKWRWLKRPIIDEWALILKNIIQKKYPAFKFQSKTFSHQPTINFTLKPEAPEGFLRKSQFLIGSFFNKEQKLVSTLFDDLTGLGVDQEAVLSGLNQIIKKNQPIYFVNFPKDVRNKFRYQKASALMANKQVGLLSPCGPDKEKPAQLKNNLTKLKYIQSSNINLISQQIDNLKLPTCYLYLLGAGVSYDYSMGYSDHPGFRAGTCTPFNWYDLQLEKVTPIIVMSYCVSDAALLYNRPAEAINTIKEYIDSVKMVAGHFYSSWQLKTLSQNARYLKWMDVFKEMLKYSGSGS